MMSAVQMGGAWMAAMSLTLPRVVGAFLMLPLLTQETMPAMVRNSFLVSLAFVAVPITLAATPATPITGIQAPVLILKELFLGMSIGFCFGMIFWAMGAAGNVLDTQVGMSMAQTMDPIQGHQASLHGVFLSQLANWLFMASGAFLIFLDLLLTSYALWPVTSFFPDLNPSGMGVFIGHFSYLMTALLVLVAPAMVLLLIIDMSFGLMNRFAPQLNVFALTMPIKGWLASAMILLLIGVYVEIIFDRLFVNKGLLRALNAIFAP